MIAIICTVIICVTVLLCVFWICDAFKQHPVTAQQPTITDEDLDKAYKDAEADKTPDFQDVIDFINKEFTGAADDTFEQNP